MPFIIISFLSCLSLFLSPIPAYSAVFNISSGDVIGLIAAINAANSNGEENTINLAPGTYTLTAVNNMTSGANGLPSITSEITINGDDAATTIIERAPAAPNFRIFHVAATAQISINRLTVRNGRSPGGSTTGGGILNAGTLTIHSSIIEDNRASGGGGILNGGTLKITQSIVRHNGVQFEGGGIWNTGTAALIDSTLSHNGAGRGGGILNFCNPPFCGAGGGSPPDFTILNSAITNNRADFGGGIWNQGTMSITNSTVADNAFGLQVEGGGISNTGMLKLTNSTIARNSGAGVHAGGINNSGIVELQNTIVALNFSQSKLFPNQECSGPITSLGNNLIGDPSGCDISLLSSDLTGDPGLGAFVDSGAAGNGRFPLMESSQAINRGNNQVCSSDSALATDQLDTARNGPCDIGAVEFYPVVNDLLALANVSTALDPTPVPGGPAGVFRITADFANTSSQAIIHPFAEVIELSGENLLLNADGGAGGVGARLTSPNSSSTPMEPGASSTFEFLIGLQRRQPFTFFVNMLGEP